MTQYKSNYLEVFVLNAPIIVVPTYWRKGLLTNEDMAYDHATDLVDPEETLSKTLLSFSKINGEFDVLVIGAPSKPSIGKEMDSKVLEIINGLNLPYNIFYFGFKEFNNLKKFLTSIFSVDLSKLYSNQGYGSVRNLCIFIPHLLNYNIAILIDDDELITDEDFIKKATEFIGKRLNEKPLGLIVGLYRNLDGSIYSDETKNPWWMEFWNKAKKMNEAFQIIEDPDLTRLVPTPFAFGGNMVISRECWVKAPFDPLIARGEDMDYLRNVKYLGFDVKLDRTLSITHAPPESQTQEIDKFKQDVSRFLYAKAKLESLGINLDDYDPYPGFFLKQTEGKVLLTELLYYIFQNSNTILNVENSKDLLKQLEKRNSIFNKAYTFAQNNSNFYIRFQKQWEEFMRKIPVEITFEIVTKIKR